MFRNTLLSLFLTIPLCAGAQVVGWKISPVYDMISPSSDNMLLTTQGGKVSLLTNNGEEVISNCTSIAEPDNYGVRLALDGNRIVALVRGGVKTLINEAYYVDPKYPYFSEEKLAVQNRYGKWGYMSLDGNVSAVKYNEARPFSCGFAAVKTDTYWQFINKDGRVLPLSLSDARLINASRFCEFGRDIVAAVQVKNNWIVIDNTGHQTKVARLVSKNNAAVLQSTKYNASITSLLYPNPPSKSEPSEFQSFIGSQFENNLCSFTFKGEVITTPQFRKIEAVSGELAIVQDNNGKYGLLELKSFQPVSVRFEQPTISFNHYCEQNLRILFNGPSNAILRYSIDGSNLKNVTHQNDEWFIPYLVEEGITSSRFTFSFESEGIEHVLSNQPVELKITHSPGYSLGISSKVVTANEDNDSATCTFSVSKKGNEASEASVYIDGKNVPMGNTISYKIRGLEFGAEDSIQRKVTLSVIENGRRPISQTFVLTIKKHYK